ncbi:MAG: STING domain-containing protein [Flavobacteriales bacterium]
MFSRVAIRMLNPQHILASGIPTGFSYVEILNWLKVPDNRHLIHISAIVVGALIVLILAVRQVNQEHRQLAEIIATGYYKRMRTEFLNALKAKGTLTVMQNGQTYGMDNIRFIIALPVDRDRLRGMTEQVKRDYNEWHTDLSKGWLYATDRDGTLEIVDVPRTMLSFNDYLQTDEKDYANDHKLQKQLHKYFNKKLERMHRADLDELPKCLELKSDFN